MLKWLSRLFEGDPYQGALLLRLMAEDAAAIAIAMNPTANWGALLTNIIHQVATTRSSPTTNQAVIQRAAVAALLKYGKTP